MQEIYIYLKLIILLYADDTVILSDSEDGLQYALIGVRQGENLSPFLFSIFLNDLEHFLSSKNVTGVTCDFAMQEIYIYLKLIILLYADDIVIFSDSEDGLQYALNTFNEYCDKWRLTVNDAKTKNFIFNSRGRPKLTTKFTLKGSLYILYTMYICCSNTYKVQLFQMTRGIPQITPDGRQSWTVAGVGWRGSSKR